PGHVARRFALGCLAWRRPHEHPPYAARGAPPLAVRGASDTRSDGAEEAAILLLTVAYAGRQSASRAAASVGALCSSVACTALRQTTLPSSSFIVRSATSK